MKRSASILAAVLLFAAPALAASGGEVAVVCDREVAPFRAVLEAFTEHCGCSVRELTLQEAGRAGLEQSLRAQGVRAVLAIGAEARDAVSGVRELPVLAAMAPDVPSWVAAQQNRLGIRMEISPRQHLETIRRVFPRARRIGLVFDPRQTGGYEREAAQAASELGLVLDARETARPADLARQLDVLHDRVGVIWLLPDQTVLAGENIKVLLLASFEARLPLYGFARKYVDLGAIAAAYVEPAAIGAQAAAMLSRACAAPGGPASARWEYASRPRLAVNQKIARKMGVVLDPAVLEAADDVLR
jgi:putative ABC transport system substrate-binding protein